MIRRGAVPILVAVLILCSLYPSPSVCQKQYKRPIVLSRSSNWSSLLTQPSAFVSKVRTRLRKQSEGYTSSPACDSYVGPGYLEYIRNSKLEICRPGSASKKWRQGESLSCTTPQNCGSAVECYTAPFVRTGNASKASISLCHSTNLVLDSCGFLSGRRKGTLAKKFPLPAPGSVKLACQLTVTNATQLAQEEPQLHWLDSIHHDVWWANATRDDAAVRNACAPGSPRLVTTPTLFVMRDRHANYAHELEVVSMVFSFLAALEPQDVAKRGIQVVITDMAPPTGFLETWARISHPHRLRILAREPFPPGTCFRSAYHVYTFAAGIGYNTNPDTVSCESPVTTGLSHWLRQLYDEADPGARWQTASTTAATAAAAAGPAAAAAGVRGLKQPTGGIVMKNVVWLSRRNLEMVRLLLNASAGWKSMRMVRNEDAVVTGLVAAVQEWNAESCLLRRFDRVVQSEYERSLKDVNPVHAATQDTAGDQQEQADQQQTQHHRGSAKSRQSSNRSSSTKSASIPRRGLLGRPLAAAAWGPGGRRATLGSTRSASTAGSGSSHGGGEVDIGKEYAVDGDYSGDDEGGETEAEEDVQDMGADGDDDTDDGGEANLTTEAAEGAGNGTNTTKPSYMIANNIISLARLWALETDGCRRTNVLFKFVDGDFNDMPYHGQLHTIFRTGVLVGVHGAGLTHGFFMPPGQSAVLQLLGESFSKVAANNVFRNMAAGLGNYYEDVLYSGVDVDVEKLKEAVKRAMDAVARTTMEAQMRRSGALRLVLVDQSHFSVVAPSPEQCPAASP
ncbi:hypothetical protein Agub_g11194 [Astrephomene gubernaculifera]|uniref:Uncharacterized protein n=1 Tax=Astrephomene gubernaculifera TaxID=47775 RepID=A0AAD3DXU2_9CHLO|nr:hypothetical protein Agub_g11194 [Astrephomene gubernaculifera]